MAAHAPWRVAHIVSALNVGGLERVVYDLVRGCDRGRFTPHVVCLEEIGTWGHRVAELGVGVEHVEGAARGSVSGVLRLARKLRDLRPDVVHTHNVKCHVRGALAARLAGVPVVINTKHGRNYPVRRLARIANRLACGVCTNLVAVSEDCSAIWREIEGADPAKVTVILNGVDIKAFGDSLSDPGAAGPRAITVARLSHVKDPLTLLQAVDRVRQAERGFRLDLVGDGPLRGDVERLVDHLGLTHTVRLHGARDQVHDMLREAALFVLSSASEGISLTLLEAMASGLPIVATRVGGNAEVVADGRTGILVPARSPDALAEAILRLLRDPDRRREMGRLGRERAAALFDVRRTVSSYERLYLEALDRRAQARSRAVSVSPAA